MKKALFLLVIGLIPCSLLAQPANDDPCGAHLLMPVPASCIPFEDNSVNSISSVFNATTSTGNSVLQFDCNFDPAPALKDVWFKVPLDSLNVLFKVMPIAGFDISMQVYYTNIGSCASNDLDLSFLRCVNSGGPGVADSVLIEGFFGSFIDTVYIRVFHHPDGSGPTPINNSQFSICTYYPEPGCVTNNFPADAQQLLIVEFLQWSFEPFATSYDVYFGTTVQSATFIGNSQSTSFNIGSLNLTPGTYFWYIIPKNGNIVVMGCSANATSFTITPTAANNFICNAQELIPSAVVCSPYVDNNTISTTSYYSSTYEGGIFGSGATCGFGPSITADVWFKFTAVDSAFHTVKVNPVSGINTSFRVYGSIASCAGSFSLIGCYNTGGIAVADTGLFIVTPGSAYFIQVFSQNGSRDFNPPGNSQFEICIVKHPPVCQAPLLVSPVNAAVNVDHVNGFVSWNNVAGTTDYDLYVGANAANLVKVNYTSRQSVAGTQRINFNTNFAVNSPFAPGNTYFWKIVPRNGMVVNTNCSEEIRSFTTTNCPSLFAAPIPVISVTHAGELDYKIYCANCPNIVFEYGPNTSGGTGTTPSPGNFIEYPAQPVSPTVGYGSVGIDSAHQIAGYRYYVRLNGCPGGNLGFLPTNPGSPTVVNTCSTAAIRIQNGKGRWNFGGQYPVNSNSNTTPGKMSWFNFTPTESGVYYLQVDSVELNDPIDYLYKPDSLNKFSSSGWTGITEINAKGKYAIGYLTANVLYHFVADRQNDTTITTIPTVGLARHFIKICKAEVNAPAVLNSCIEANIRKPIPALSAKEEFAIDNNGRLIASIKAGSDSLGFVNVSYYVNGNGLRYDVNGKEYLDRNYTITPSATVSSQQQVKLFFTNDELNALINAPNDGNADVYSIDDLVVTKTDQACINSQQIGNIGNVFIMPSERGVFDAVSGFVKIPVNSFSTFYLHGGSNIILPLRLLEFTARKNNKVVELSWKTSDELNLSHFIVERSTDGWFYSSLGMVPAFNIAGVHKYNFKDLLPQAGTNFYRLKLVDIDNRFTFSDLRAIKFANSSAVKLYPSHTNSFFTVSGIKPGQTLLITDIQGKSILSKNTNSETCVTDISSLASGIYVVKIIENTQHVAVFKIVKQ